MALGLVARASVVLSDTINSWYRVWKGTDPESVYLRLPTAGSFEVRHSVTNAPVVKVTDAGVQGIIQGSDIVDGTISSAEIANNTIVDADVNSAAAIAVTKLAHVGAGNVLKSNGTANVGAQVADADVAPTAAVGITKLAHVGSGNVLKSNGTANVGAKIVDADVAAGAGIGYSKLALGSSITSADIADQAIMNADVNNAAAIAYSKLALANSIVTGDIVNGTIVDADINGSAGIAASKLGAGGTANRVVATADGTTVAMQQVTGAMIANATITAANLSGSLTASGTTVIASQILASPFGSVTLSGITSAYKHLELRIYGRATAAANTCGVGLWFNSDTTALYAGEYLIGTGAAASAGEWPPGSTYILLGNIPGASANASAFGALTATIPNHAVRAGFATLISTEYYMIQNIASASNFSVGLFGGSWYSTAPITSIIVFPVGGVNFATGTQISLYGWN